MNEFLSNIDKYNMDTFEYNGHTFIRESHNSIQVEDGFHCQKSHLVYIDPELEKQYQRKKKLERICK